ncbi:MAG: HupE/UreJ family protein [Gammaproteobacteria bacterium]|nr:HupE/UreJ family protein [Gammaproteobacteria bacterium]
MLKVGLFLLLWLPATVQADVVKPTMIDISVHANGRVELELHLSIEALLTGINNRYRNTKSAPQSEQYDALRALPPEQLASQFEPFIAKLLDAAALRFDDHKIELKVSRVDIPEAGYQKVPRASVLYLEGMVPRGSQTLTWYFPQQFSDNAVRVKQVDDEREKWLWSDWVWLTDDQVSEPFPVDQAFVKKPLGEVVASYIHLGFVHIVPYGLDHILFVLGIFLLTIRLRPLLAQVTMFTLAHSITLALAAYGVFELPARVVEPLIALSIAYIGIENIFSRLVKRRRLLLVFGFGLLHGLGFAGVLKEFGMPPGDYATALISFNVGVEAGQIAIVALAFLIFAGWQAHKQWYRMLVVMPVSGIISVLGLIWTYDRIVF